MAKVDRNRLQENVAWKSWNDGIRNARKTRNAINRQTK